jgi:aspartate carbamoyltransferase catalytic subunit
VRNLLSISDISTEEIAHLIERAQYLQTTHLYPNYSQHSLTTLFYENSTRTRVSFEWAAKKMHMSVIHINPASSSESKGESIEDTLLNLEAMGLNLFVMRHQQNGLMQHLVSVLNDSYIINAGDGTHQHPSQALLDIMTIKNQYPSDNKLKVAIVGNLKHSRVANSFQQVFSKLNLGELRLIAPKIWWPEQVYFGDLTDDMKQGLQDVDIVMALRIQKERLDDNDTISWDEYKSLYMLNENTMKWAKPEVKIMHPGPVNHDVELASSYVHHPQSLILSQVNNGVFMRMAILEWCLGYH